MNLFTKTEIDSWSKKTNIRLPKEKGGGDKLGVWDGKIQTTQTTIYKMKKNINT